MSQIGSNSYNDIYLTLDMDWAPDEVLSYTLDLLAELEISPVTFFVTHDTPLLHTMRERGYELGVHPNYLPLLKGEGRRSAEELISELHNIVPEAVSVRSHGLVTANYLSDMYVRVGFTHEANTLVPITTGVPFRPYEFPKGLTQVGHCWGDSWQLAQREWIDPETIIGYSGLRVLLFHPIHIFLNTCSAEQYTKAKPYCNDPEMLESYVNKTRFGIHDFLRPIVALSKERGMYLSKVSKIAPHIDES